jgi:hypothetical protein
MGHDREPQAHSMITLLLVSLCDASAESRTEAHLLIMGRASDLWHRWSNLDLDGCIARRLALYQAAQFTQQASNLLPRREDTDFQAGLPISCR